MLLITTEVCGTGYRHYRRSPSRSAIYQRRNSPSDESPPRYRRSMSPDRNRRRQRRSPTFSNSESPPVSMLRSSHGPAVTEQRGEGKVKDEKDCLPQRAVDRRTRRHKQAAREEEIAQRKRDGKKPFYLTLDAEGKPYGPGKPAWVAEIGKLAAGLDPSCTHISRQTYEAVTTLKSRLNESFEYSGTLSDDHLRSMMGKAVTKKRTDLISLIKKGGSQPLHIDHEVWERLVKLAASRQQSKQIQ